MATALTAARARVLRAFVRVVRLQRYESVVVQWKCFERWYDVGREWPRNAVAYAFFKCSVDPLQWYPSLKLMYLMGAFESIKTNVRAHPPSAG